MEHDEKENIMEGLDPALINLLKDNGMQGRDGQFQWNNPLIWLIILGFLKGEGGLFGGGNNASTVDLATASSLAKQDAKLDCLAQGQQEALAAAHNMNMTNLFHQSEVSANNDANRLAAQLAECCCKLGVGQKDIINEILKCCCTLQAGQKDIINNLCLQFATQTSTLTAQNIANTQRILDSVERHADDENRQKLDDCKQRLSNEMQTKEILAALSCNSNNNHGGGRGKSAA